MSTAGDHRASHLVQVVPGAMRTYVIFGGIKGGLGVPVFEFMESSRALDSSRVFLRDHSQAWYAYGLEEIGKDVFEVADWISAKLESIGTGEARFVGNSMGGFAAILFGSLLGTGRVVAFSPQSTLEPGLREEWGDNRWSDQIRYALQAPGRKVTDLRRHLESSGSTVPIDIHVSTAEPLDVAHANHLHGLPGVTITAYRHGGHAVVRHLRDTGKLAEILKA